MQAIMHRCYGDSNVLKVEPVAKPAPADDEILVKVRASSINPLEWHLMTGTPYVMRASSGIGAPSDARIGVDFSGTVEAVGKHVERFKPGDEVFGAAWGTFAEYIVLPERGDIVSKPSNVSFEEGAAAPIAAVTALQALRDHGHLKAGQSVLINGASGGVGTFAVQIAKSFGAEVTGVCSTRNLELVRSLGADHVIDYTQEDFTRGEKQYDLIVDNVGNRDLLDLARVVKPDGRIMLVGAPKGGRWIAPLWGALKSKLIQPFVDEQFTFFVSNTNQADLMLIGELMSNGKVKPVIDRRYALRDVPEAMRYLQTWHARGKVVITTE
jgi:NADPH:quinone reductase-like Zn-dependent oxidoreductase